MIGISGLASLVVLLIILHMKVHSIQRTKDLYQKHFSIIRHERLFLSFIGFFLTIFIVRSITLAIHYHIGSLHDISAGGVHIHHLVWGILLLLAIGYIWVAQYGIGNIGSSIWLSRITAIFFGVGAALTLDEFALWLHLQDVYWSHEGRESIQVIILFGSLLAIGTWGHGFFRGIIKDFIKIKKEV